MPILQKLLWIVVVIGLGFGLWRLLRDRDWFPDEDLYIALTAGFIGSIFFALVSPVIVPWGYHALAMFVIDTPEPTYTTAYSDDLPEFVDVNDTGDLDYYAVTIINQDDRPISSLSLTVDVAGCVDRTRARSYAGLTPENYDASWAPASIVHFSQPSERLGERTQCDAGLYIETLPAHRMVTTYFIVDRDPGENVRIDFTGADVERGQIFLDDSYMWEYQSIRRFPDRSSAVVNASTGGG